MCENEVIIIGAGAHARGVADIIVNLKDYKLIGFLEKDEIFDVISNRTKRVTRDIAFPIFPDREIFLRDLGDCKKKIILGIGQNLIPLREKLIKKFKNENCSFCSVIHPKSIISVSTTIGEGAVIMAGAIINPFAAVGDHVVINSGAVVEHECVVGENTFIQPGAHIAGNVHIGRNSIIGIGVNVKEGIRIGSNTIIGGGAFVNRDVPDNVVYIGVPAKKLRDNQRF